MGEQVVFPFVSGTCTALQRSFLVLCCRCELPGGVLVQVHAEKS